MGAAFQRMLSSFYSRQLEVVLVGLENSGKTTLMNGERVRGRGGAAAAVVPVCYACVFVFGSGRARQKGRCKRATAVCTYSTGANSSAPVVCSSRV